jgi:hypothetical protein
MVSRSTISYRRAATDFGSGSRAYASSVPGAIGVKIAIGADTAHSSTQKGCCPYQGRSLRASSATPFVAVGQLVRHDRNVLGGLPQVEVGGGVRPEVGEPVARARCPGQHNVTVDVHVPDLDAPPPENTHSSRLIGHGWHDTGRCLALENHQRVRGRSTVPGGAIAAAVVPGHQCDERHRDRA